LAVFHDFAANCTILTLGNILVKLLNLWVFLAVIVGVAVTYQFGFWESLVSTLLGWVLLELATRVPWLRIRSLDDWLWRVTTGKALKLDTQTLADRLAEAAAKGSIKDEV
jgi:hypothetical protein